MRHVVAHDHQSLKIVFGLNTLGRRRQMEAMRHVNDGPTYRTLAVIHRTSINEAAIQFQLGERRVTNIGAAEKFYDAIMSTLGVPKVQIRVAARAKSFLIEFRSGSCRKLWSSYPPTGSRR